MDMSPSSARGSYQVTWAFRYKGRGRQFVLRTPRCGGRTKDESALGPDPKLYEPAVPRARARCAERGGADLALDDLVDARCQVLSGSSAEPPGDARLLAG